MAAGMLQGILPSLRSFFMNPAGLLALAGLVPLLVFYLVRPEPEEKVMPSMMFFRKSESDSKLRNALRTLLRNLILLLHVLIVAGFAVAIANPFIQTYERTDRAVVVIDRSASMEGQRQQTLDFLEGNLGRKNTVIMVDDEVNVRADSASPDEVEDIVRDMRYEETRTDVATAIQTGLNYRGRLLLASDLDQTVDTRSVKQKLDSTSKPVLTMEPETSNSWAFTGAEIGENTTEASIYSFRSSNTTIDLDVNGDSKKQVLKPGHNTISVDHAQGRNVLKLPQDGLSSDNRAYLFVPDSGRLKVRIYGSNRYFEKAIELIDQTRLASPSEDASVHVFLGSESAASVNGEVKKGDAAVVFPDSDAMEKVFGYQTTGEKVETEVILEGARAIDLGTVETVNRSIEAGESISSPGHAAKIYEHGEGRILTFNVDSQDFREDLMYPVFWKNVLLRISDEPTTGELNIETGSIIESESVRTPSGGSKGGKVEATESGFYTAGGETYAVNLFSIEESGIETLDYSTQGVESKVETDKSLQNLSILLILLLIGIELSYLRYRGDV